MQRLWIISIWVSIGMFVSCGSQKLVYISDSHAGSFNYFSQVLPSNGNSKLLLIDAHSDLVPLLGFQAPQCYNWILPLMPQYIKKVHWIVGGHPGGQLTGFNREMKRLKILLGQDFASYEYFYNQVSSQPLGQFLELGVDERFEAISVDLDAFSGSDSLLESSKRCAQVFEKITELPEPKALSIAISRNYLQSDEEAWVLLRSAIKVLKAKGWHPVVDQRWSNQNENSQLADEQRLKWGDPPSIKWEEMPEDLSWILKSTPGP